MKKSTVDEIRTRFDNEVERFSNLETGQSATMDAPLVLELLSEAAAVTTPHARHLVDVGCGAGNNALKILDRLGKPAGEKLDITLLDLSGKMLERAEARIRAAGAGHITVLQQDVREVRLAPGSCDLITAAAVLHHLRTDDEWRAVFKVFQWLRPGGSLWISDLITHTAPGIQTMMWCRYGEYLAQLAGGGEKGEAYRQKVFAYVEAEDSPRPLVFQLELLREVGFVDVEVLHKNSCFAAFGGVKRV